MGVAPIHKVLTLLPPLTLLTLHNGTYAYIYCSMVTALWHGYVAVTDSEPKEGLSDGVEWNLVTGYPLDWR